MGIPDELIHRLQYATARSFNGQKAVETHRRLKNSLVRYAGIHAISLRENLHMAPSIRRAFDHQQVAVGVHINGQRYSRRRSTPKCPAFSRPATPHRVGSLNDT